MARPLVKLALGLPLVVPVAAAPWLLGCGWRQGGACHAMPRETSVVEVATTTGVQLDCAALCGEDSCSALDETHVRCYRIETQCQAVGRPKMGATIAHLRADAPPNVAWALEAAVGEASSVVAFDELRRALLHHGAPPALCAAAHRARLDEVNHARAMTALAATWSGHSERVFVEVERAVLPTLEELAWRNVVEGCVVETFAAKEAALQAKRAPDRTLRAVMAPLAAEEADHAALAADIDAWLEPRLSHAARREKDARRAQAIATLRTELAAREVPPDLGLLLSDEADAALRAWGFGPDDAPTAG
ncbi:MAG: hypothetical protein H6722_10125 [Sandaracinus sp.]|nr:hypothetical protein [Sandaracinus sp.]MCB9618223.1 hypothetical protein [Sandaracinus sp.]MCB9625401.1 hypothetical protein [Sandaracinus sp.]